MKVSLVTIHRVMNYGTVLQAFSTQEVIKELGHQVEIVDYITTVRTLKKVFFNVPKSLENSFLKRSIYILMRLPNNILKYIIFKNFRDKNYILTSKKYYKSSDLKKDPPISDIYLVGSDQVWNSKYNEIIDEGFFLNFGDEKTKKIAYASSFGFDKLPEDELEKTKELLSKFNLISVREKEGLDILNTMNLNGTMVLDPTLLFDKKKWMKYLKSEKIKEKYVLLFLLYNEDNGASDYAKKIANAKGIKVIQICWNPLKKRNVDKLALYKSPFTFLRYVRDAEYIVTNSFHGTAFAINFNKQFITVQRKEFNSRLESILRLCRLSDRYISKDFILSKILKDINYQNVNEILKDEREKSLEYLKNALL